MKFYPLDHKRYVKCSIQVLYLSTRVYNYTVYEKYIYKTYKSLHTHMI